MVKVPYVNLKEQHRLLKREILSAVDKSMKNCDFVLGSEVFELEKRFAKYCGTKYAAALNSGTDALFFALKACGVGAGDEVITSPNSFLATATATVALGAIPVFADVRADMNIDPDQIRAKITRRTKAIIPVHLTGKAADMGPIMEIARKHKLAVIEDAAQAIGTEYKGKRAGSFGHANAFSLHPLKTLNACGDGGMLTTNDEKIYTLVTQLRNIGLRDRIHSDIWGYNSRLDSLQAAFVNAKFPKVDSYISQRRKNAAFYRKGLSGVVDCATEEKFERHAYHLFVIQAPKRDELAEYLLKNGIETKIHYPIPIHLQKCAKSLGYKMGDFPEVEKQSKTILSLPIHQYLSTKQLEFVIKTIRNFYKS